MLDPVIHQEARLRIVALLHRNGEASFKRLGDELSLTPGNLGAHVSKLEEAAYVRERQALTAQCHAQRRPDPAGRLTLHTQVQNDLPGGKINLRLGYQPSGKPSGYHSVPRSDCGCTAWSLLAACQ